MQFQSIFGLRMPVAAFGAGWLRDAGHDRVGLMVRDARLSRAPQHEGL